MNLTPRVSPAVMTLSQSLLARLHVLPDPDTSAMTLSSQSRGSEKVMRMFQLVTSSWKGPSWTRPCQLPGPSDSWMTHSSPARATPQRRERSCRCFICMSRAYRVRNNHSGLLEIRDKKIIRSKSIDQVIKCQTLQRVIIIAAFHGLHLVIVVPVKLNLDVHRNLAETGET